MVGAEMSPHPISTHDWVSSLMTRAINHSQEGLKLAGRAELEGEFLLILAHHFFFHFLLSPLISASLLTVISHFTTVLCPYVMENTDLALILLLNYWCVLLVLLGQLKSRGKENI